jgi:hypothetical protein
MGPVRVSRYSIRRCDKCGDEEYAMAMLPSAASVRWIKREVKPHSLCRECYFKKLTGKMT